MGKPPSRAQQWEAADHLLKHYPGLDLGDKVSLNGGGIVLKQGLERAPNSSTGDEKNLDKHHVRESSPVESATYFQYNAATDEARSELMGRCSRCKRRVNQRFKEFLT